MSPRAFTTSIVALILAVGGCVPSEHIVPKNISTMVNEQGRERTYDLAWQDIRRFEGALSRGESLDYSSDAVIILSRMNRLAEGKAGAVNDASSRETLERAAQEAAGNEPEDNLRALGVTASKLREAFDKGNFALAQQHALECLAYSRAVDDLVP